MVRKKEIIADEKIKPLVQKIIEICTEEEIDFLIAISVGIDEDSKGIDDDSEGSKCMVIESCKISSENGTPREFATAHELINTPDDGYSDTSLGVFCQALASYGEKDIKKKLEVLSNVASAMDMELGGMVDVGPDGVTSVTMDEKYKVPVEAAKKALSKEKVDAQEFSSLPFNRIKPSDN